jgi:hypothetical protein
MVCRAQSAGRWRSPGRICLIHAQAQACWGLTTRSTGLAECAASSVERRWRRAGQLGLVRPHHLRLRCPCSASQRRLRSKERIVAPAAIRSFNRRAGSLAASVLFTVAFLPRFARGVHGLFCQAARRRAIPAPAASASRLADDSRLPVRAHCLGRALGFPPPVLMATFVGPGLLSGERRWRRAGYLESRKWRGLKLGFGAFCIALAGWLTAVFLSPPIGIGLVAVGVLLGFVGIAMHFVAMFSR